MTAKTNYEMPEGLSPLGERAYHAIIGVLEEVMEGEYSSGGCKVFYSPKEWKARGEEYGTESELVVVYDGGDHAMFFEYNREQYALIDKMRLALEKVGVWSECCTCWYSAVYKE